MCTLIFVLSLAFIFQKVCTFEPSFLKRHWVYRHPFKGRHLVLNWRFWIFSLWNIFANWFFYSQYSGGAVYTPEREDEPSDDTDAPLGRQKESRTASPPPQTGLSNLSALGSLLSTAANERNDISSRNARPQSHINNSSLQNYDRPTPHQQHQGRSTPSHQLHDRHNSSHNSQRTHSPSAKKRKRQSSPGAQSSSGSSIGLANSLNSNQQGSSSSPPLNNNSMNSPSASENHPPHAVNLSVCPPSSSPPPRLMVLKQELISNDEESSNGDKERLERLEQRERLCNLFEKERLAGMIKLGGFIDSDMEGEEEPPPSHEDETSGDMDTHGGSALGLPHPLSSSLQQSFVPSYSASSHSAAAAAAAAAAHHFANTFPPGSSGMHWSPVTLSYATRFW